MSVDQIQIGTKQVLKAKPINSNTFKLKYMKDMIAKRKKEVAEADGLDPNTIKCGITTEWSKICMTATAAMTKDHLQRSSAESICRGWND